MALETGSGIWNLNVNFPEASDDVNQGDDHLRFIKQTLKNTFNNISATLSVSASALNFCNGLKSDAQTQLDTLSASLVGEIARTDTLSGSLAAEITRTDTLSASLAAEISRVDTLSASLQAEITRTDTLSASLAALIVTVDALSQSIAQSHAYGVIYLDSNSTLISATTSMSLMTAFDQAGSYENATLSTASGHIAPSIGGVFQVHSSVSFSGDANTTLILEIYKNDEAQGFKARRKLGASGDLGNVGVFGQISANASDEIKIRVQSDTASSGYHILDAQLSVKKVD